MQAGNIRMIESTVPAVPCPSVVSWTSSGPRLHTGAHCKWASLKYPRGHCKYRIPSSSRSKGFDIKSAVSHNINIKI
jgi:hypothetical protein